MKDELRSPKDEDARQISTPGRRVPRDIGERTLEYAVRAVGLFRCLLKMKDEAARVIGRQFLRSATSVGANIEEAHFAESRVDFIHKYRIARKEVRESLYWLRVLVESGIVPRARLGAMIKETEELIAIVTTIILNAKESLEKPTNKRQSRQALRP
jgi:four helix bundle protein